MRRNQLLLHVEDLARPLDLDTQSHVDLVQGHVDLDQGRVVVVIEGKDRVQDLATVVADTDDQVPDTEDPVTGQGLPGTKEAVTATVGTDDHTGDPTAGKGGDSIREVSTLLCPLKAPPHLKQKTSRLV